MPVVGHGARVGQNELSGADELARFAQRDDQEGILALGCRVAPLVAGAHLIWQDVWLKAKGKFSNLSLIFLLKILLIKFFFFLGGVWNGRGPEDVKL